MLIEIQMKSSGWSELNGAMQRRLSKKKRKKNHRCERVYDRHRPMRGRCTVYSVQTNRLIASIHSNWYAFEECTAFTNDSLISFHIHSHDMHAAFSRAFLSMRCTTDIALSAKGWAENPMLIRNNWAYVNR